MRWLKYLRKIGYIVDLVGEGVDIAEDTLLELKDTDSPLIMRWQIWLEKVRAIIK